MPLFFKIMLTLLKFKKDCRLQGWKEEMNPALMVCWIICAQHDTECLVNSCNDGRHGETSLHYAGYAFDLDTHDTDNDGNRYCKFPISGQELADIIRSCLPPDYDVIFEGAPGNEHIHIEYQPKRGNRL